MKQQDSRAFRGVLKSIQKTYGFMLERGYEVFSTDDYDLGWQLVLRKQDLYANIIRSRREEEIYFRTSTQARGYMKERLKIYWLPSFPL